ncbi:MAG TPA: head GIN domain-containing protein [Phnomibacter sp.]|nr:head GIN domain-containing protein [Phnomibacter sp.]
MKKLITLLLLAVASHSFGQKVIYDANANKREIPSFHGISASTGVEVIIAQGEKEGLAVSTSAAEFDKLVITEVKDGILKIHVDADWKVWKLPKNWKVKAYVSYKQLDQLKASSGASIKGDIQLSSLSAHQSSGGFMVLKGTVDKLEVDASSGGIFKGYDLTANTLEADASSGGAVQVTVVKEVNAEASSGGSVNFKGNAVIKSIDVSSGGSVKKVQ